MFRPTPRHAQAKKNKNKLQSIALPTELTQDEEWTSYMVLLSRVPESNQRPIDIWNKNFAKNVDLCVPSISLRPPLYWGNIISASVSYCDPHQSSISLHEWERDLTNSHMSTRLVDHRPLPIIPTNQPRHVLAGIQVSVSAASLVARSNN